mmetsp:Transcript_5776/g.11538  ORF Transcript_5776/g.11538 Transcript_5776/m.11538 type:complete len:409 (-) Transcript_5776:81-1307(-)
MEAIGLLEPLETLQDQFAGSDASHQMQKIFDLADEFGGWRHVLGDGNCYYRAIGFCIVEMTLLRKPKRLRRILEVVRKSVDERSCQEETEEFLRIAVKLMHMENLPALEAWMRTMLTDPVLDHQLVTAMRVVSGMFLLYATEMSPDELPLSVVEASQGVGLQTLIEDQIMIDGCEAESVSVLLAPMAFKIKIEIIQLDRSAGQVQRYVIPEGLEGEPMVTLLYRPGPPGHYDILYKNEIAQELLLQQVSWDLHAQEKKAIDMSAKKRRDLSRFDSQPGRGAEGSGEDMSIEAMSRALSECVKKAQRVMEDQQMMDARALGSLQDEKDQLRSERQELEASRRSLEDKQARLREELEVVDRLRIEVEALNKGGGNWWSGCCACVDKKSPADAETPRHQDPQWDPSFEERH